VRNAYTNWKRKKIHEVFLIRRIKLNLKKDGVHHHKERPAGELAIPVYFGFSAQV
jgi:hypothetical protein